MRFYFVGHIAYDTLIYVNRFPSPNSAAPVYSLFETYGGAAANCAVVAAKMDEDASIVSCVGEDFPNSDYDRYLSALNIDTSHVKVIRGHLTSRAYMPVDAQRNQMSFFYWGASEHLAWAKVPKLKAGEEDIIHIANGDPAFNRKLASAYRHSIISFDPGYDIVLYSREDLEYLFRHIDFLFVNEHELRSILIKTRNRSERDLLKYGVECVVVTEGAKGSTITTKGERFHVRAPKAKYVDPTGAGDAYRAGFLVAFAKGKDLRTCGRVGSAVAGHVIEHVGAQTGVLTWEKALAKAKRL